MREREREKANRISWLYESSQPSLGISIKRRLIFISVANCAWYGEGGGGGEARVEFKINDYKLSRSPCAKTLVCTASRAFHHRFGIWCIVSCSGEGEGGKKKERGKKRERRKNNKSIRFRRWKAFYLKAYRYRAQTKYRKFNKIESSK